MAPVEARTWTPVNRDRQTNISAAHTHGIENFCEVIGVRVSHVCANYSVSALALESLLEIDLGESPERLARRDAEEQVVLVVARYRRAVVRAFRQLSGTI